MEKIDCLFDYVNGCMSYYEFLERMYVRQENDSLSLITNPNNNKFASIAIASLLLSSIKESLIDFKEEDKKKIFYTKSFDSDIEKAIKPLTTIKDNKYYIGDVYFNSKEEVVDYIRNKLAHGDYIIDISKNNIILNKSKIDFTIDIDLLLDFIVFLTGLYFKQVELNQVTHNMYILNKFDTNTTNIEYEIFGLLNNAKILKYSIMRTSGEKIEESAYNIVTQVVNEYKLNGNIMLLDKVNELLNRCNYSDYVFSYQLNDINLTKNEKKKYAKIIRNRLPFEHEFFKESSNVSYIIGLLLHNYLEEKESSIIAGNSFRLLRHLNALRLCKTSDYETIRDYMYKKYNNGLMIDDHAIITQLISIFSSLFCYCNDDIFFDYLDYSYLDVNGVNWLNDGTLIQTDFTSIDDNLKKLSYNITVNETKIKDIQEKVERLKNEGYTDNIDKILSVIPSIQSDIELLKSRIDDLLDIKNLKSDPSYAKNRHIINGIRNSIAHGHYYISVEENINDSIIKFIDIDPKTKNEEIFEVTVSNFFSIFVKNEVVLFEFFKEYQKNGNNTLKRK